MTFEKRLRDSFEQMMAYRNAVGYATATYRSSVPPFIDHCARNYANGTVITQEMVDSWFTSYPYSVNSRAVFISLLREYTKYLRYDSLVGERGWFFQKWNGGPYETSWYNQMWRRLLKRSPSVWRGVPRPYDLRHAFASRNITRWMETGKDVMELLPYLSAYMGHSGLTSTLYYIHMLPEKLRSSAKIDWEKLSLIYGKGVSEDED